MQGQLGHGNTVDIKSPKIVEDLLSTAMGLGKTFDQWASA